MRNKTMFVKMNSLNASLPLAGRVKNINKERDRDGMLLADDSCDSSAETDSYKEHFLSD